MFKDSHEVNRNVGIMAVLLAVLVLAGLYGLGAAFLTGMGFFEKKEVSTSVLIEKGRNQIKALQADLEEGEKFGEKVAAYQTMLKEVEDTARAVEEKEKAVFEAEEVVSEARLKLAEEVAALEGYQSQYRELVRTRAEGEIIDLSEFKGEEFKDVRIMGVSPLRLRVMTKTGVVGIDYPELPEALQERFQFNEEEAAAYREWLKVQGERRDQQDAMFRERQKAKQAEQAKGARIQAVTEGEAEVVRLQKQAQALLDKVREYSAKAHSYTNEANAARAAGRVTSKFGLASQAKQKADSYQRRAQALQAQIAKKNKELALLRAEVAREANE